MSHIDWGVSIILTGFVLASYLLGYLSGTRDEKKKKGTNK